MSIDETVSLKKTFNVMSGECADYNPNAVTRMETSVFDCHDKNQARHPTKDVVASKVEWTIPGVQRIR